MIPLQLKLLPPWDYVQRDGTFIPHFLSPCDMTYASESDVKSNKQNKNVDATENKA